MNYSVKEHISEETDERENDPLTGKIIGAAIDVHRALGQACLNRLTKPVSFMN